MPETDEYNGSSNSREHECDDNGVFCRQCDLDDLRQRSGSGPALTWDEIVEHCSRLHTTRTRPVGPWEEAELREDAHMLDVWVGDRPAVMVPTRMHEPGFYVRYEDDLNDHLLRDPDALVGWFRDAVECGSIGRRAANCGATESPLVGVVLFVCTRPADHDGDHRDMRMHGHTWPATPASTKAQQ